MLGRARVIVDHREPVLAEAGEVMTAVRDGLMAKDVLIELGGLVTRGAIGRERANEITVFKSVGLAVQDVVAGGRAVQALEGWVM